MNVPISEVILYICIIILLFRSNLFICTRIVRVKLERSMLKITKQLPTAMGIITLGSLGDVTTRAKHCGKASEWRGRPALPALI